MAAPHIDRVLQRPIPRKERTTLVELCYQAGKWERSRRVVLVLIERPGELFLDHFFLLTNAPPEKVHGEALLARYRERGISEKDLGEWKTALDVHLSSTPRPKRHYRQQPVPHVHPAADSFGANEANLLLSMLAANLLHVAETLLRNSTRRRCSRQWFRDHLLKKPCRVALSGRGIRVIISASAGQGWRLVCKQLDRIYPVRGSPNLHPLPESA